MTIAPNRLFIILAVVLFLVGLVLNLVSDPVDAELMTGLLFAGLASFAAGHLT